VNVRILPQVESGEVEAERVDRPDQPRESAAGRRGPGAAARKRAGDGGEVAAERGGVG
jgi:hypothetical protein